MSKRELYGVVDGALNRKRSSCPKCGAGVFLAEHSDRLSCGRCGYTEFKKKGRKE
ncbi:MAG: 30S ribosomal protein S27ae [Candidatus Thermoplasmatota archaeon]|nr:30S ribosomal protein S27ae [Candidatus Thermoplasmatota archaeon]